MTARNLVLAAGLAVFGAAGASLCPEAAAVRDRLLEIGRGRSFVYAWSTCEVNWTTNGLNGFRERTGDDPLAYFVEINHTFGTWPKEKRVAVNRPRLAATIKAEWKMRRAVPFVTWHLENPYAPTGWKDERYGAAPMRYRYSSPGYPEEHRYVAREILDGTGAPCGTGRMDGTTGEAFPNPRSWFDAQLDEFAAFCEGLKDDAGRPIPVVLRLFHECEDDWQWWGRGSASNRDFIALYRYAVTRLREKDGAGNLMFCYSPNRYWKDLGVAGKRGFLCRYPGDEYVEFVGFDDYYLSKGDMAGAVAECVRKMRIVSDFGVSHGKVCGLYETGVNNSCDDFYSQLHGAMTAEGVAFSIAATYDGNRTFPSSAVGMDDMKAFLAKPDVMTGKDLSGWLGGGVSADIVIYGSTPAALTAAVQAKRMGRSVVVVSPEARIGGLTTGGLGQTDIGNKRVIGGLAREFYRDVAKWYADPLHWTRQKEESYFPGGQCAGTKDGGTMWTFEPSAALAILEGWEKREGLDVRRGERLDREHGLEKKDGRIFSVKTLSGNVYHGKVFIDATYEGDLMAAAGVTYHVGREANSVYGETLNGNQPGLAKYHQLNNGVDPYVVPGNPSSGLLPGVEPLDPDFREGDGDRRVQAYCFRMCLTDDPANMIPFAKPMGYDERDYELLFRSLAIAPLDRHGIPWINSKMPNRKTDTNSRTGFSTDFVGANWNWPEASYSERDRILARHLEYQKGLVWTLANHPRVPEKIRKEVSRWGTCRDEFTDGVGDGWQSQLYVREARRMVGEYVMTEHNCRGTVVAPRSIAMGAYTMDSHHVRRHLGVDGFVHNEGDVEVDRGEDGRRFPPYPIDYGAIVPKRDECVNLLVPVCLSASHIAFGSIRMEPVFFALGQAAGTAAAIAVEGRTRSCATGVQDVPYEVLRERLVADGQIVSDLKGKR